MLKRKNILLLLEWYDYRIHRGVAQVARERGWQLNCPKDIAVNEGYLKDWQGDGCIALLGCKDTLNYFWNKKIPLVDLGLYGYKRPVPRVVTDNRQIGRLAAEHFRDHGYREVFAISAGTNGMYHERLEALRASMQAEGGKVTVLDSNRSIQPAVISELRRLAARKGKQLEELSQAFFAYQDTMASEMISLCLQNDLRVPENMAVLGVDNDDLVNSGSSLGMSSVDSDQEGLGRSAAQMLLRILEDPKASRGGIVHRHPPKGVVVRRSTDCYALRNPLVANALHWIQKNFYKGIQATDVAVAMGVSQQGLQKAFAANYLRSPGQEIRHQRIQAVANLLGTTHARLGDIAANCGFNSVNSLITGFRKTYGQTPGKFRKRKREEAAMLAKPERRLHPVAGTTGT
jgi:LacI family transcriptional regulator